MKFNNKKSKILIATKKKLIYKLIKKSKNKLSTNESINYKENINTIMVKANSIMQNNIAEKKEE